MKVILIGATGATGKALLPLLLSKKAISEVIALVRKPIETKHPKLKCEVIDFSKIEAYAGLVNGDVAISCLGTTLKDAGSKAAQYEIDFQYQYNFAQLAKMNNVPKFILVSAAMANPDARLFYPRIKGQLEKAITELQFDMAVYFRPGILLRPNSNRVGERLSVQIIQCFNKIGLLKSMQPLPVANLAELIVAYCLQAFSGVKIVDAQELINFNSKQQ